MKSILLNQWMLILQFMRPTILIDFDGAEKKCGKTIAFNLE